MVVLESLITVNVHTNGKLLENDVPLSAISDVLTQKDHLLWLDGVDPTPEDIRLPAVEFSLHPLAIEDVRCGHARPKIDFCEGAVFVVFCAMEATADHPPSVEPDLFAGANDVITIHDWALPFLDDTRDRWCRNVEEIGDRRAELLVGSILDAVVDRYFPCVDGLSDQLEDWKGASSTGSIPRHRRRSSV